MNKNSFFRPFRGAKRASGREVGAPRRVRQWFRSEWFQWLEGRQLLASLVTETLTTSATVPIQLTDFTAPLTLAQFNPALGTLDSVNLTLAAVGNLNGTVVNEASGPASLTVDEQINEAVTELGVAGPLVAPNLNASQSFTNVTPGVTLPFGPFAPAQSASATFTSGGVFNSFIGTGNVSNLDLTTNTIQTTTGSGGNFARDLNTLAGATATVTYTYTVATVSVSGNVYDDVKGTGSLAAGDLPIPGTTLSLLDSTGAVIATTKTAADGTYSFTQTSSGGPLFAGTYDVIEAQPAGYLQGKNTVGTVNGVTDGTLTPVQDVIAAINLAPGQDSINNNFGEVLPVGLTGIVYEDVNGTGSFATGDLPIAGATVNLFSPSGLVASTTTDAKGDYVFTRTASGALLPPDTYTVVEYQPAGYLQGSNTPGTVNGVTTGALVATDVIGGIALTSGQVSLNNDFGEVKPVGLTGTVYDDVNHTGSLMAGDLPIGGVRVNLLSPTGLVATTTTDVNGNYQFTTSSSGALLPPASYTLVEIQPAGFQQGTNTVGKVNGVPTGSQPSQDVISAILLKSGQVSLNNNFGELTPTPPPPPPPPTPINFHVTGVDRFGVHLQPTLVVISFDQPLNLATANDPANYQIFGPTDSKQPAVVPIESATYNPATNMVTLRLGERLNVHHPYRLTIINLQDTSGGLLVGSNGLAGSPYVATVNRSNLSGFTDIYGNFIPINHGQLYPAANASGYQLKKFKAPANLGTFATTNLATFLAATAGQPETPPINIPHHGKKVRIAKHH